MSKLVTKQEDAGFVGTLRTILGEAELNSYRQHHASYVSSEDKHHFLMKVAVEIQTYVNDHIKAGETLNKLSDLYHFETLHIAPGLNEPEVIYGVTGWKEFYGQRPPVIDACDAVSVKKELAWRALVCLAFDYLRQDRYMVEWQRLNEDTRTAACY